MFKWWLAVFFLNAYSLWHNWICEVNCNAKKTHLISESIKNSQAIGTVDYDLLIQKLHSIGFDSTAPWQFHNYPSDRWQHVKAGNIQSDLRRAAPLNKKTVSANISQRMITRNSGSSPTVAHNIMKRFRETGEVSACIVQRQRPLTVYGLWSYRWYSIKMILPSILTYGLKNIFY